MTEWILLLTLNLIPAANDMRDVSMTTVPGFSSIGACETAAKTLAERTISLVGRAREQRGLVAGSRNMAPSINYECVQVRK